MVERRSAVTGGGVGLIFLLVWLDSKLRAWQREPTEIGYETKAHPASIFIFTRC